jgi:hypothetical protein
MKKLVIACSCILLCSLPALASILGDNFHMEWDYPNLSTAYASTDGTLNPTASWLTPNGLSFSIADGTITLNAPGAQGFVGSAFVGFSFTDTSEVANFTSFTLVSVTGYAPPITPALSFVANELAVNFTPTGVDNLAAGIGFAYTFAFTTAPVPEPSTISLTCLGALAVASCLRRSVRL